MNLQKQKIAGSSYFWWFRSINKYMDLYVGCVLPSGRNGDYYYGDYYGVVPVCIII